MNIYTNSLEMHKLFPVTHYGIAHDKGVIEGLHSLSDHVSEKNKNYVSEIINFSETLKKLNIDRLKRINIQININDYYYKFRKGDVQAIFLSDTETVAWPLDDLITWGLNKEYTIKNICSHFSMQEEVEFTLLHELAHILEYDNINEAKTCDNENSVDVLMNFMYNEKTKRKNPDDFLLGTLLNLSREMYADTMAVLLKFEVCGDRPTTMNFLDKLIVMREKESLVSVHSMSNTQELPVSDHFTVSALEKLREIIKNTTSLEEREYIAEQSIKYGMAKNMLFMMEVAPDRMKAFFASLSLDFDKVKIDMQKEIGTPNSVAMQQSIERSSGTAIDKFKSVFHPKIQEQAPTKPVTLTPEAIKYFSADRIVFWRQDNQHNSSNKMFF